MKIELDISDLEEIYRIFYEHLYNKDFFKSVISEFFKENQEEIISNCVESIKQSAPRTKEIKAVSNDTDEKIKNDWLDYFYGFLAKNGVKLNQYEAHYTNE